MFSGLHIMFLVNLCFHLNDRPEHDPHSGTLRIQEFLAYIIYTC